MSPSNQENKRRLLIVDDHPIMRQGLMALLNSEADLTVCGQASTAPQGLAAARELQPDLAIVDISLKGVSGIDLIRDLRNFLPKLPILVLSMHDEALYAERALRAGARGYVMKQEATENIAAAIRRVLAGHLYVSSSVTSQLVGRFVGGGEAKEIATSADAVANLSNRELQVLQLIGRGRGTRAIAEEMKISVKTVETYRANLKEKLKLRDAPELMCYAVKWVNEQDAI